MIRASFKRHREARAHTSIVSKARKLCAYHPGLLAILGDRYFGIANLGHALILAVALSLKHVLIILLI